MRAHYINKEKKKDFMEDEKWQENQAPEGGERSREGYKPYNRENSEQKFSPAPRGERIMRPRMPRAERAYSADGASGIPARPYRPSYNREERNNGGEHRPYRSGGYQPRQGYNREGGYGNRENGYGSRDNNYGNREGGYRPREGYRRENNYTRNNYGNREGGYTPREGGFTPRTGGFTPREGGFTPREGNFTPHEGGYNREGGYRGGNNYRRPQGGGYNNNRFGGPRSHHSADYNPHAKYSLKKQIEYKELNVDPDAPIRLNKFLANAGVCSRREADEFITAGVVSVNGVVVTELGTKVKRSDEVKFHDQAVNIERKVYVLLNKPKDYVTTSEDPQNRKTVMDLVKDACRERIYPVGRLDRNTTGVLLFTNDGELASKLTHPKFLKKKIYHVYTDKNVTAADMRQIAEGITLEDGDIKADAIEYASPTDKKQVGIEIHSGKNRIVRRIFESLGYRVVKLDRVQFAGLTKKNLRRGDWRFLTEREVNMLRMGAFE